jgi:hypothetical protein
MSEPTIICPNCKSQNKLTESLAAPIIQAIRAQCEGRIAHKESDVANREAAILRQQSELAKAKAGIEQRIADAKAELLRRRCELDDEKRDMNLTIERKVQESLAAIRQKARQEAEDALKVEIIEKNEFIASLKLQLEEKDELIASVQRQVAEKEELIATMQRQVEIERQRIAAEEAEKARLLVATGLEGKAKEVADLQQVLRERDKKLAEAQNAQAELIRKQRELDDAKREVELTVEKRVHESLVNVRHKAKQEAEDALKLQLTERDELIAAMQRQVEELKRKSEQGSQQLQGEAQEIELEALLRSKFPGDQIEPVAKGEFGGDILQRVMGPLNQNCGTILWEIKRTKNWSDGWLPKLRDDQRAAKAEIALLVSHAIPKGVAAFDYIEGVWVTEPRYALPVAIALRQSLIEIATARVASVGQKTKMELVYQYLTGPLFRQRIEAIVEKFSDMQADLAKERKAMTRLWAKRESQIRGVIESTVGMYGDLQGIAGKALPEIDGLDVQLLDSSDADEIEAKAEGDTIEIRHLERRALAPKEGNGGLA